MTSARVNSTQCSSHGASPASQWAHCRTAHSLPASRGCTLGSSISGKTPTPAHTSLCATVTGSGSARFWSAAAATLPSQSGQRKTTSASTAVGNASRGGGGRRCARIASSTHSANQYPRKCRPVAGHALLHCVHLMLSFRAQKARKSDLGTVLQYICTAGALRASL